MVKVDEIKAAEGDEGQAPPVAKKSKLEEEELGKKDASDSLLNSKDIDETTQQLINDVEEVQKQIDNINEQSSEEILKVEQKYNKLRKPHYDKRGELIGQIPNFWVLTCVNHPQFGALLSETDEEVFQSLKNVEVVESEDIKSGYKLIFTFGPNEYFENEQLVKEYQLGGAEPSSTSTEIKWKPGVDLSKQDDSADTSSSDDSTMAPYFRNFFSWFTNNTQPMHDEFAECIKDELWPNPLQFFLNPEGDTTEGFDDLDDDEDDMDDGWLQTCTAQKIWGGTKMWAESSLGRRFGRR